MILVLLTLLTTAALVGHSSSLVERRLMVALRAE